MEKKNDFLKKEKKKGVVVITRKGAFMVGKEVFLKNGFEVVRSLVGHGVGYGVHEEPAVPNYGERGKGQELQEGLVIAIEPMLIAGGSDVVTANDGWTVEAKDGALAAHEEHTVAITQDGPLVLTKR